MLLTQEMSESSFSCCVCVMIIIFLFFCFAISLDTKVKSYIDVEDIRHREVVTEMARLLKHVSI